MTLRRATVPLSALVCCAQVGCGGAPPAAHPDPAGAVAATPTAPAKVEAPPQSAAAPSAPPAQPTQCKPPPPAGTLAEQLDRAQQACGGVLLVTRDDGLHALTLGLEPIARLRDTPVRHVQVRREGDARELHYFAANEPELLRFDLRTGREEALVKLPRLEHPCFTSAEPGDRGVPPADPVEYIQMIDDLDLDLAAGVLCVDISDRNVNMASLMLNFRADLRTRAVVQRTTFIGEECRRGAGREQKAACTPKRRSQPDVEVPQLGKYGLVSPSGRWAAYGDEDFEESGDYIYRPAFMYDTQTRATYAVTPAGLVKFDRAAKAKALPKDVCYLAGEASTTWLPGRDVLVIEGCGAAGWLVVEPPARVQAVDGRQVTIYG